MLSAASSELPVIGKGITSLHSGGFEIVETGIGSNYRVFRVFGDVDTSAIAGSFDWSHVIPGFGSSLHSKVCSVRWCPSAHQCNQTVLSEVCPRVPAQSSWRRS